MDIQYGNVREVKRELIHNHLIAVVQSGMPIFQTNEEKQTWEQRFTQTVTTLLIHHGFGEQNSIKIKEGEISASVRYGVKYLTKGSTMGLIYNEKKKQLRRGGYHVFTRSRRFGRTLQAIGLERNQKYIESLENRKDKNLSIMTALADDFLSQAVGAKGNGGTPSLDSTYKIIYADST
jgi:hypothetical protein